MIHIFAVFVEGNFFLIMFLDFFSKYHFDHVVEVGTSMQYLYRNERISCQVVFIFFAYTLIQIWGRMQLLILNNMLKIQAYPGSLCIILSSF